MVGLANDTEMIDSSSYYFSEPIKLLKSEENLHQATSLFCHREGVLNKQVCRNKITQTSGSSSIVVGNYTGLHVTAIPAFNICHISLYYYHTTLISYLLDILCSYTQAFAVHKFNGVFQLHFVQNLVQMIL